MKIHFKIREGLLSNIRSDLERPHAFAYERVGFISTGFDCSKKYLTILAREYRPVLDDEYLEDPSVGAMMGPDAIRRALQWAMQYKNGIFHVHMHRGSGLPGFSKIDVTESNKFVPDFLKVAPERPHGAIVLSEDLARGRLWFDRNKSPINIVRFTGIGSTLQKWSGV